MLAVDDGRVGKRFIGRYDGGRHLEAGMRGGGVLSERSHFIPDRPRQLEVLLRVVRSTEQPPSRICGVIAESVSRFTLRRTAH